MSERHLEDMLVDRLRPIIEEIIEREIARAGYRWKWKSPAEAGRLIGISAGAIRKRAREGRIPHAVEDGRIYIDMAAYDEQLREASVP